MQNKKLNSRLDAINKDVTNMLQVGYASATLFN